MNMIEIEQVISNQRTRFLGILVFRIRKTEITLKIIALNVINEFQREYWVFK